MLLLHGVPFLVAPLLLQLTLLLRPLLLVSLLLFLSLLLPVHLLATTSVAADLSFSAVSDVTLPWMSCVLLTSLPVLTYTVTGILPVSYVVAGVNAVAGIHNGVAFSAIADILFSFASLPAITASFFAFVCYLVVSLLLVGVLAVVGVFAAADILPVGCP
jgi:hypothetical protein